MGCPAQKQAVSRKSALVADALDRDVSEGRLGLLVKCELRSRTRELCGVLSLSAGKRVLRCVYGAGSYCALCVLLVFTLSL